MPAVIRTGPTTRPVGDGTRYRRRARVNAAIYARPTSRPARPKATVAGKLSWKEARELAELPERIAALEAEQKAIGERLADPALYQSQGQEAQRLSARLGEIDEQLLGLLERWEALEG